MLDIVRAAVAGVDGVEAGAPGCSGVLRRRSLRSVAAEHQPSLCARDLTLVALAAGGVPTDLAAVVEGDRRWTYSGLGLAVP